MRTKMPEGNDEAATFPNTNSHRTINSVIHSTCGSDPSWSQEYLVEEIFGLADLGKEPHLLRNAY